MAKNPQTVQQFLSSLIERFTPLLERELSEFAEVLAEEESASCERQPQQQQQSPLPPLLSSVSGGLEAASPSAGAGTQEHEHASSLLALCDLTYVCNRVEERRFAVDHKLLREYFPMPHVLQVLFEHYQVYICICCYDYVTMSNLITNMSTCVITMQVLIAMVSTHKEKTKTGTLLLCSIYEYLPLQFTFTPRFVSHMNSIFINFRKCWDYDLKK